MALTLSQAESLVRSRTRHTNASDVRATQAIVWAELNRAYKELRARLEVIVPELYVETSAETELADGVANTITVTSLNGTFRNVHRFEIHVEGYGWRPVARASLLDPNDTPFISFHRDANALVLGPDIYSAGTYRVKFHIEPNDLSSGASTFALPSEFDNPLALMAAAWVGFNDDSKTADCTAKLDLADKLIEKVTPALRRQYGTHQRRAGLRYTDRDV